MEDLLTKQIKIDYVILGTPTANQIYIIKLAMDTLKKVINDQRLREFILYHQYPYNNRIIPGFAQSTKSNREILTRFVNGDERNQGNIDFCWNYIIKFYYKSGSVIGYTNTNSSQINLNTKFMGRKPQEIVNTLVHEMVHILGGEHSYRRSPLWKYTAPYDIGSFAEMLAADILGESIPSQTFIPRRSLWRRFLNFFK